MLKVLIYIGKQLFLWEFCPLMGLRVEPVGDCVLRLQQVAEGFMLQCSIYLLTFPLLAMTGG